MTGCWDLGGTHIYWAETGNEAYACLVKHLLLSERRSAWQPRESDRHGAGGPASLLTLRVGTEFSDYNEMHSGSELTSI